MKILFSFVVSIIFSVFTLFVSPTFSAAEDHWDPQRFSQMITQEKNKKIGHCAILNVRYIPSFPCGMVGDECGDDTYFQVQFLSGEDDSVTFDLKYTEYADQQLTSDLRVLTLKHVDDLTLETYHSMTGTKMKTYLTNRNRFYLIFFEDQLQEIKMVFQGEEEHSRSYNEFSCRVDL